MLRAVILSIALLGLGSAALLAAEADNRACASNANQNARVEACSRAIADQGTKPAERALAYRNRAIAYNGKKLYGLAVLDADEALKLSPQDQSALIQRGWALTRMGQFERASADFAQALRLNPRSDRAHFERGLMHERKGDLAAAIADFEAAIKINPRSAAARNSRGFVLAKQGKPDLAIVEYGEALRANPDHLWAHVNRGRAYQTKGANEQALADFKRVAEHAAQPRNDDEVRAIATAKQELSRLAKAMAEGRTGKAERRVALVIGNAAYAFAPALRNPVNDTKTFAAALRALGFAEVREVHDANLSVLGQALKEFGDLAAGADWAIIYYAGHGIEVAGTNYLIPVDAKLESQSHVEDEALPLSRLLSKVTGATRMQLVVLDACRNNPFAGKMKRSGREARAIGRGLASIEPESGVLVAYSARDGTTALDGDTDNSPFAEALVKHIAEPGLEISLLFRKVRDEVYTKTGRQQEPFTYGSLPAQPFYFKR
jgi:tetratricopeptide (TPR) repeat protein